MSRVRLIAVGLALVAALAGCAPDDKSGTQAKGGAELNAIKVPATWKMSSSRFEPSGMNRTHNQWTRFYDTPDKATEALAAYDEAARAAGWQAGDGCPLSSGHGCWVKPGFSLTATPGQGSGCKPGDKICAIVEVTLIDA
jgi:hypothetical protein